MTAPFPLIRDGELERYSHLNFEPNYEWKCYIIVDASNGLFELENDYISVILNEMRKYFTEYFSEAVSIHYVGRTGFVAYRFRLLFVNHDDAILFSVKHGM